jgi:hypothetical protein
MYQLTDKQVDYILDDIRSRGIVNEDLQQDLLDHVCCLIEQKLEENDDFEAGYRNLIKTFYTGSLAEIEEETIALLTYKNYYTMKKMMILSGTFSAITMVWGLICKFMHWPGAAVLLPFGILSGCLVFIPLFFTLKAREQEDIKDKLAIAAGAFSVILVCLSFVFKIMGWPHPLLFMYGSAAVMLILFLPLYLYAGWRNPAIRMNTLAMSVLIVMGYCLLLTIIRTPRSQYLYNMVNTHDYVRNEQILRTERRQLVKLNDRAGVAHMAGLQLNDLCEEVKSVIIEAETGHRISGAELENANILLTDRMVDADAMTRMKLETLKDLVLQYNEKVTGAMSRIPTRASFIDRDYIECYHVMLILNEINQIQMFLLQNEREMLAVK